MLRNFQISKYHSVFEIWTHFLHVSSISTEVHPQNSNLGSYTTPSLTLYGGPHLGISNLSQTPGLRGLTFHFISTESIGLFEVDRVTIFQLSSPSSNFKSFSHFIVFYRKYSFCVQEERILKEVDMK